VGVMCPRAKIDGLFQCAHGLLEVQIAFDLERLAADRASGLPS